MINYMVFTFPDSQLYCDIDKSVHMRKKNVWGSIIPISTNVYNVLSFKNICMFM